MSRRTVEELERRVLRTALEWRRAVLASEKATAVRSGPVHEKAAAAEVALREAVEALADAIANPPS